MPRVRHRIVERLRLIALLALLLVPIAFSGHQHATNQVAQPCAVCVVTQHTPVTSTPNLPVPTLVALVTTVVRETVATPPSLPPRAATGRGPPTLPLSSPA